MDTNTIRPKSDTKKKTKLSRTFHKVIKLRNATKIASTNAICILTSQSKVKGGEEEAGQKKHSNEEDRSRNRAVMEALISKLFASITSIKAAYAELQMAQYPYDNNAIQAADQSVVDELKAISDLKRRYLRKELVLSPQVTIMLSEIQEQQSLMKTYEITIKKLQAESVRKDSDIDLLKTKLYAAVDANRGLEKKLNSSGSFSMFGNLQLSSLNPRNFAQFLQCTLRSVRNFVKLMVCEMESARWDLDAAVKFIEPDVVFTNPSHRNFAFESFVCKTMLEGFNDPNFTVRTELFTEQTKPDNFFENFRQVIAANSKLLLCNNRNSPFGAFTRSKYFQVVHAKMECSLFGNLNQRKAVNSGCVPETAFFAAFAEMSKRVWLLHCLAFSLSKEVAVFQVRKNCRFSDVYMESVSEESSVSSSPPLNIAGAGCDIRVVFTVVPGFRIGKSVVQCLVYLG